MRRRQIAWLLLAVVSLSALVAGTGGFDTAVMDRGVSLVVSDHEHALVSIWDPGGPSPEPPQYPGEDPVTRNETRVKLLVVESRVSDRALDLRVMDRPDSPVAVDGSYDGLASGETTPVMADVDCNGHHGRTDALLLVRATAEGGGFESEIRYDASLVCPDPAPSPSTGQSDA